MIEEATLDCIVRFHDIRRLPELERCIFSLARQTYRPLNIILVLQRFSAEDIEITRTALEPFLESKSAPSLSIHNWNQASPADGRTFLLNLGLSTARGRYLAFLDYDDVLFPEAYELMVSQLRRSGAAIGFASVQMIRLHPYEEYFYTEDTGPVPFRGSNLWDLFKQNFCPLHSYVLDRQQIPADLLHFNTSLAIEEDYDLLLRICAQLPSDFSLLGTPIGYYSYKTDGSNTVANSEGLSREQKVIYQEVCTTIERRRQTTRVSLPVQAMMGVGNTGSDLTIRDILDQNPASQSRSAIADQSTARPGWAEKQLRRILVLCRAMPLAIRHSGDSRTTLRKASEVYRREGLTGVKKRIGFLLALNGEKEPGQRI